MPKDKLAIQALMMDEDLGMTNAEIGKKMRYSERYIRDLKALARKQRDELGGPVPDPRGPKELDSDFAEMVQPYLDWEAHRYNCKGCGLELKPKPGDCCVFCSYGSVPCPPIQQASEQGPKPSCCG